MLKQKNVLLIGVLVSLLIFGLSIGAIASEYTIRIGHLSPRDSLNDLAVQDFAKRVEELTEGRIEVKNYPDSIIGGEREMMEAIKAGDVEMTVAGSIGLQSYAPQTEVVQLPYIFPNEEKAREVIDSKIGQELKEYVLESGYRVLAFYEHGGRHVLSKEPLKSIEDFEDLKIRVPETRMFVQTFKQVGASPTSIPYSEVYTSLQTGVVEAYEGTPDLTYHGKMHEVAKNYTLTNHIYVTLFLVIGEPFYDKLPQELQEALLKAGKQNQEYQRSIAGELNQEAMTNLEEAGVKMHEIDTKPFREAVQEFNIQYAKEVEAYDIYKQIMDMTK